MAVVSSRQQVASAKIKSFTDLIAWQKGHALVIFVYKTTETFPKSELFGLTSQMRRAAVSVTSNIAEGFSRATQNDKRHFYQIAQGSLTELQNQIFIARDIGYIKNARVIEATTVELHKIITGLIKSLARDE